MPLVQLYNQNSQQGQICLSLFWKLKRKKSKRLLNWLSQLGFADNTVIQLMKLQLSLTWLHILQHKYSAAGIKHVNIWTYGPTTTLLLKAKYTHS